MVSALTTQELPARTAGEPAPVAARLEGHDLVVDANQGRLLEATSVQVAPGGITLATGEPGHGHTALALALGGRLVPDQGWVALDGRRDLAALRRAVALVDTPGVTEPDAVVSLTNVIREELVLAGRPAGRRAAAALLERHGASEYAKTRFEQVPMPLRTALLANLAVVRPGVTTLILTAPDRAGDDPATWWELATNLTSNGLSVIITCTETSAAMLGMPSTPIGGGNQSPECVPGNPETIAEKILAAATAHHRPAGAM